MQKRDEVDHAIEVLLAASEVRGALARVGVFVVDHAAQTRSYNELHYQLGFKSDVFEEPSEWLACVHPEDRDAVERQWREVLSGNADTFHAEYRFRGADGEYRWLSNSGTVVYRTSDGHPRLYIGADADITELKRVQAELAALARNDPLLGILNRRGLEQQAAQVLASARRRKASVGMLVVDLDHFKSVNYAVGHAEADRLLRELAARTVASIREMDLVGRYGGDELVVIIPDATREDVLCIGRRLVESVRTIDADGLEFPLTVSVGATAGVAPGRMSMGDYFRVADRALFNAKDAGRNQVSFLALDE